MNIVITLPKIEDARDIQQVFYETWLDTYPNEEAGITRDDIEDKWKNGFSEGQLKRFAGSIKNPPIGDKLVIAKLDKKIIGVCRFVLDKDKNELKAIYVLPKYQRIGVGRLLWDEVIKLFNQDKKTIVNVATYNKKAINFYQKLGFVDTGRRFSEERFRMKSGSILPETEMVLNPVAFQKHTTNKVV